MVSEKCVGRETTRGLRKNRELCEEGYLPKHDVKGCLDVLVGEGKAANQIYKLVMDLTQTLSLPMFSICHEDLCF
jgi:hypothetical protein